ncbi:MAG: pyruvate kinase [Deltaproteobacteria bacterium]|nr:MAG: pyruvate kinase [Deltaproteobacteria bacterium]
MPRTKIICTIGPASETREIIQAMIHEGMNVARLNFSHGDLAGHEKKIRMLRSVSDAMGTPVAILQDLCGPKIRVGKIAAPGIRLEPGQDVILTTKQEIGQGNRIPISYEQLPHDVTTDDIILLADGMMELVVRDTHPSEILCKVITGGVLTSNKGINLPSSRLNVPSLTDKDKKDLAFGIRMDVDYVALSFVRCAEDIKAIKAMIQAAGKTIPVVAKIEKHESLSNIDAILEAADAIMIARGDLGVEIPLETVPNIQKRLIRLANNRGKPVIVATQMLRSMCESPRPTRAEANDVANAVLDGADAVMLSEESASGLYPVKAVHYLAAIASSAEERYPHTQYLNLSPRMEISESVAYAACVLAEHLGAQAVVAATTSGFTAKQISRFRPRAKILAMSHDSSAVRRLSLYWGCIPLHVPLAEDMDQMFTLCAETAVQEQAVAAGDRIVITAGYPLGQAGTTTMIKVKEIR